MIYQERDYRNFSSFKDLVPFRVVVAESDLYIRAGRNLSVEAHDAVRKYRQEIEEYIRKFPQFEKSLAPIPMDESAPLIVKGMMKASRDCEVGPMASVAGAIAEFVGKELLEYCPEVIVENGGDIFMKSLKERVVGIFAGESPLSHRVGIRIVPEETPIGICTSSGTVGPSFSLGKADAVCVLSPVTPLADAAATAIGNLIKSERDIPKGLNQAQKIRGVSGVVIIVGKKIAVWGKMELLEL